MRKVLALALGLLVGYMGVAAAEQAIMFVQPTTTGPVPVPADGSNYPIFNCSNCGGGGTAASTDVTKYGGTNVGPTNPFYMITPDTAVASGSITSTQSVTLTNAAGGLGTFTYDISGTWTGTIVVEAVTYSGGTFYSTLVAPFGGIPVSSFSAINGAGQGSLAGIYQVRLRGNTVLSGSATINLKGAAGDATQRPINPSQSTLLSGCANATGTSGTSVISAVGAGIKIYITSISIANTGASTSLMTLQSDPTGSPATLWATISPTGGGSNITFPSPLVGGVNKAVGFTAGTASTTQSVCMSGYSGG